MAPGESEFDTPVLEWRCYTKHVFCFWFLHSIQIPNRRSSRDLSGFQDSSAPSKSMPIGEEEILQKN